MDYYVVKVGDDRYDLRQSRYRVQLLAGREHPHDLMACGFTAAGMRELLQTTIKGVTDTTALPPAEPQALGPLPPGAFAWWDNPCPRKGW